ncbi:MAG: DUF1499 domain-containing protein [Gammaproteobacteria bacterium]|nr:DUF1499 domain-containing protein [Gammaproteobacteria bacterium]
MGKLIKLVGMLSVLAFPISVLCYRLGLLPFHSGLQIIQIGALAGVAAFVVGILFFLIRRKADTVGAKAALVGAIIGILPVIPLGLQAKKARSLPFIHNVSTDTVNAPEFDKIASIRTESDNPHTYNPNQQIGETGTLAQLQLEAYPNVKTYASKLSPEEALAKAEEIANELGWEIVNINAEKGILEATETTLLWGFKDDIIVRVEPENGQTLIDLHSVSRFGGSDLGVNAARIERFLDQM